MRLTLDRGAMEVLLNNMSEEAKADFSNKVVRQVLTKLTTDLTLEQFERALKDCQQEALKEHLESVTHYKPELSASSKRKVKEAFEHEEKDLLSAFRRSLSDIERSTKAQAARDVEEYAQRYVERHLNNLIDERVREAISRQLGSLVELGEAMREMKTVTPEASDEPE